MRSTPTSSTTSELETKANSKPSTPTTPVEADSNTLKLKDFLMRAYNGYTYTAEEQKNIRKENDALEKNSTLDQPQTKTEISPDRNHSSNSHLLIKLGFITSGVIDAADTGLKDAAKKAISHSESPRKG